MAELIYEAAGWFQRLRESDMPADPAFFRWVTRSPRHVEALIYVAEVDAALRDMGAIRSSLQSTQGEATNAAGFAGESRFSAILNQVVDRFRRHGVVALFLLCSAVVGVAWSVFKATHSESPLHGPTVSEHTVLLSNVPLAAGSSVTTPDGRCLIIVSAVATDQVGLRAIIEAQKPLDFRNVKAGSRLLLESPPDTYYVDLHRIRGTMVDLTISRSTRGSFR